MEKLIGGKVWMCRKRNGIYYASEETPGSWCRWYMSDELRDALIEALGLEEAEPVCEPSESDARNALIDEIRAKVYAEYLMGNGPVLFVDMVRILNSFKMPEPEKKTAPLMAMVRCLEQSIPTAQYAELMKVHAEGRAKWQRAIACKNIDEATEWWYKEGEYPCSYCKYYLAHNKSAIGDPCNCALGGVIGECVKQWRDVNDVIDKKCFFAFHVAAKAMYDLIVRTPMILRKETS